MSGFLIKRLLQAIFVVLVVTLFAAMGFVSGIKKRTVVRRRPGRPLGSNAVY